ncbi:serine/threonine protein kinase [Nannizzia gypsea CBS 118893]|uniref:Serine/threonine protein kinase n=1 Tax=Arthroderma gypseum (strain ATCC MYA-4604 / CBS 118893) TaxID=535722 RepID=E4V785_ARTGP|nr:serine/threonine protein kinase [Nannizzia gypsea CBS 118893]EFQ96951.1 serine/threonine protein kinase [Nannizzia gypsea CBS 118893]
MSDTQKVELPSFESRNSYSFKGYSLDPVVADSLCSDRQPASSVQTHTKVFAVEDFFEECQDVGARVISESDFEKGAFVGSGATMQVYEGRWKSQHKKVALKYFKAQLQSRHDETEAQSDNHRRLIEACMLELRVLTNMHIKSHENIANLLGVSWHQTSNSINPILVMELACPSHPTLKEVITTSMASAANIRLELFRDVLEGISALHKMTIIHGDVKPENILVFDSTASAIGFSARISDFGFCSPTTLYKRGAGGTPYWNAPECMADAPAMLKAEAIGPARDIYSMGLLASFLLTGDMPFGSSEIKDIARLKLEDKVSGHILEKLRINALDAPWEKSLPKLEIGTADKFLVIISRMLARQAKDRPSINDIRQVLKLLTSRRNSAAGLDDGSSDHLKLFIGVMSRRFIGPNDGVGEPAQTSGLSRFLPRELQQALYEILRKRARSGNRTERAKAANRLGVYLLNGIGSLQNFEEAFTWFSVAARLGSIEAKKMVFRMERAADTLPKMPRKSFTFAERSAWMIDLIAAEVQTAHEDSDRDSGSANIDASTERIRRVLSSANPDLIRRGLSRDIEDNVVRCLAIPCPTGPFKATYDDLCRVCSGVTELTLAFNYVLRDDDVSLNHILAKYPVPKSFLDRLVTLASDATCNQALRTLCIKHGADPNYIDRVSGRDKPPIITAMMTERVGTVLALLDCGADAWDLLAVLNLVVKGTSPPLMAVLFALITADLRHETLDGLQPSMNSEIYPRDKTPPDNSNPPPIFLDISTNRLDRIFTFLRFGADPRARFNGWEPVHLAVRLLHPSAVLLLSAFGGDPNARLPSVGYMTPLHVLSQVRLQVGDRPGLNIAYKDFLRRPYIPPPLRTGESEELVHRQSLVVYFLLELGADPSLRCADGFTPLMTSILSISPDAKSLTGILLHAGVPVRDLSSRGETVLHICAAVNDPMHLKQFFLFGAKSMIDLKDKSGCTALFLACLQERSREVVKVLLENSASLLIRGTGNLSPLDAALLSGDSATLEEVWRHLSILPVESIEKLCSGVSDTGRTIFHHCLSSSRNSVSISYLRLLIGLIPRDIAKTLAEHADDNGYTPWQVALAKENGAACEMLSSRFNITSAAGELMPCDFVPTTTQDVLNERDRSLAPFGEADSDAIRASFDDQTSKRDLKPVEACYQVELEAAIQSFGEESREAIWCMDTLGTVYERYGRLSMAQEVYYRGWTKSLRSFGQTSVVTQDLASKILRVSRDRGLEKMKIADVAEWHSRHGKNNLAPGMILDDNILAPPNELPALPACFRHGCGKPSTVTCPGCSHACYCSESCQVEDIIDPRVQHLSYCFLTESLEMSQSIIIRELNIRVPHVKKLIEANWATCFAGSSRPRMPLPKVKHLQVGILRLRFFQKPIRLPVLPNSIMVLLNRSLYEMQCSRQDTSWYRPTQIIAYEEGIEAIIRPADEAVQAALRKAAVCGDDEAQELEVWVEIQFDCELRRYF